MGNTKNNFLTLLDILAENSPGLVDKVHVLYHRDGLMFSPVFVRSDMDKELRDKIVKPTVEYTNTIEGKQLMMMFQIDGLTAVTDDDYKKDKEMARRLGFITQ